MTTETHPHTATLSPADCADLEHLNAGQKAELQAGLAEIHAHNFEGAPVPAFTPEFRAKVSRYAHAQMARKVGLR
mgnify:CR=1 FL=1